MNLEARKKLGRDQEHFQLRRKNLWTETAVVNLSPTLRTAVAVMTNLTGLAMGLMVEKRLTKRC